MSQPLARAMRPSAAIHSLNLHLQTSRQTTALLQRSPSHLSATRRLLSQSRQLRNKTEQKPSSAKPSSSTPPPNQAEDAKLPGFSFEGLGISRNMKILIYVILGFFGTLETITYGRWIYVKWIRKESSEEESSPTKA